MDAVKFIKERQRMCAIHKDGCFGCPMENDAEGIVTKVEEWSAAHPHKTRQSVFLEQWPDTQLDREGSVIICPRQLCKGEELTKLIAECRGTNCYKCRREFWRKVVR